MWVTPLYSRSQVKKAGKVLGRPGVTPVDREAAIAVVNNWRSAHSFPLNTLQVALRRRATKYDSGATTAQRVKRLVSIERKLQRISTLDLARIQDLGGCRAVVEDLDTVRKIERAFKTSRSKHRLVKIDDYIAAPKNSGYRSLHLTYEYQSSRSPSWNGLLVEVQIRTRLQHAWATAVETVGLFTNQQLKSGLGDTRWLRFFALVSAAFADREAAPAVPGVPGLLADRLDELRALENDLNAMNRLTMYRLTARDLTQESESEHYLLNFDNSNGLGSLRVTGFNDLADAMAAYTKLEATMPTTNDVVLVQANSVRQLELAYPNYFADTKAFVRDLMEIL